MFETIVAMLHNEYKRDLQSHKNGCHICDQVGRKTNNRLTYSTRRGLPRTDESFALRYSPEHYKSELFNKPTALESSGMVTQFPVEPMHLLGLGVCKKKL